ncbi:MAG: S8 family serine peptidase [Acidobacteria bacterium]|nr:S8 family serine peptidase [Acidobacteriota bacterium]
MPYAPKQFDHPSFGKCELIATLAAIKWANALAPEEVAAALTALKLKLAPDPKSEKIADGRNPFTGTVNQSTILAFVTLDKAPEDEIARIVKTGNVEWAAPVYKAVRGDGAERSYFAINPAVIVLSAAAAAAVDMRAVEERATVDAGRSSLMRGFVVYKLPGANAIDVAARLAKSAALAGIANAVSLENIPFITPTCGGCGCGSGEHKELTHCGPATAPVLPTDPLFVNQWGLQRINAPSTWAVSKGDGNIVVAVLDQGVELGHPDLNVWPVSYSTITHTNNGSPVGNHGTACAGIISSRMNNALGATGLSPQCPVMAIATNFADTEVAEGLYFAADNGARVVSMSFGVYASWMIWNFAIIEAALQYCHERNVVLVAASGNENIATSRFPGSDPRTICIGGSNRNDVRKSVGDGSLEGFWGACYGPDLDIVAPCLEIPTTDRLGAVGYTPTDYTLRFNGTSSATPHVAAAAGLLLSVNPELSNIEVRQILDETADKINIPGYVYLATAGKPFGTWNNEAGYGRLNVERAVLAACERKHPCGADSKCGVCTPEPENCCVSPCDPPWRPSQNCITWYEERFFRQPLNRDNPNVPGIVGAAAVPVVEFRVTYEHLLCLLGKQQGPLMFTTTLLPGETVRLYHSDRYRRVTTTQQRYSVQTTFMQFLSTVHQARVTNSMDALSTRLTSSKSGSSDASGGGFFGGLFGFGGGSSSSSSSSTSAQTSLGVHVASEAFFQSVHQASQLTHAERSIMVSTYEDKESVDTTVRTLNNANECRAVTYFVRQVMELYAVSTRVADIQYRIVAQNVPPEWHNIDDLGWLPDAIQVLIRGMLGMLPKIGTVVSRPRPVSIPTDGLVYDAELAHCCSCEPERAAAIQIRLERQKAEAKKLCLEAQQLELELERRKLLLGKGQLGPFEAVAGPVG